MTCVLKYLCILSFCLSGYLTKHLPPYVEKCKLEYPGINDCLIQRVKDLKPYLEKGIPELKLPALKSLKIPKVELLAGSGGSFSATFNDIVVYGAEELELPKLDFNLEKQDLQLDIYFPNIRIQSIYSFTGKLLILELNGHGLSHANITNIYAKVHTDIKRVTRDGKDYVDLPDFKPFIKYDKPSLYFEDLFKGNKELTEHTNKIINENISEIQKEIKPLIDDVIHKFVHRTVKQVFIDYSIDELFA